MVTHNGAIRRISLCMLLLAAAVGCDEQILHELQENQANRVRVILGREGITAKKMRDASGWSISVPQSSAAQALAFLEDQRVRTHTPPPNQEGSQSLLQSKDERHAAVERTLSWQIEQTLERLPGVLEARVHLNRRQDDWMSFSREANTQSASVLLIVDGHAKIEELQTKALVAGASGVKPNEVVLLVAHEGQGAPAESVKVPPSQSTASNQSVLPSPSSKKFYSGLGCAVAALAIALLMLRIRRKRAVPRIVQKRKLRPIAAGATTSECNDEPQLHAVSR